MAALSPKPGKNSGLGPKIITSPFTSVLIFSLIVIALIVNFKLVDKVNKRTYSFFEENVDANRKYNYFDDLTRNYKVGKDIRLYNMQDFIMSQWKNSVELHVVICLIWERCSGNLAVELL